MRRATWRIHLTLRPGEKIRGGRSLVLFWEGDRIDAHNEWRRLLLEYYSPRPGGKPFTGLLASAVWGAWMNCDDHIAEVKWWADNDLPLECYWLDAGWGGDIDKSWVNQQSDRVPNRRLFPDGVRPLADVVHDLGMKFLLWFVPESIDPEAEIGLEHPEWIGEPFTDPAYGDNVFYFLNHCDPEVNEFMIDYFSRVAREHGVDIFRQDGIPTWPVEEDPDREGINQIRCVEGFYEFWDGLLKNDPNMMTYAMRSAYAPAMMAGWPGKPAGS